MKWAQVTYLNLWLPTRDSKWSIMRTSALFQMPCTSFTPSKYRNVSTSVLLTIALPRSPLPLFQAHLRTQQVAKVSQLCLLLTISTRWSQVLKCPHQRPNAYVCLVKWKHLLSVKSTSCKFCSRRLIDVASLSKNKKRKFRRSFTANRFSSAKKTLTLLECCKKLLLHKTVEILKSDALTVL